MEILKKHLEKLIKTLSSQQRNKLKNRLDDLISVYRSMNTSILFLVYWD